jgi:hypothetical protein
LFVNFEVKDPEVHVLPATGGRAPASEQPKFITRANRVSPKTAQAEGVTNIKFNVDPKFDQTNYQTEIMIEIEQKLFKLLQTWAPRLLASICKSLKS